VSELADADDTETLATRAAAGDTEARGRLLQAIRPETMWRRGRFLPFREDAEEAAQDVLLQVTRNIQRFEGCSRFSA